MCLTYFVLLLTTGLCADFNTIEVCMVTEKKFETGGYIPQNLFRSNTGILYETNENDQWCYHYLSYTYKNTSACYDSRYTWDGVDGSFTAGVKELDETLTLDQIKEQASILVFTSGTEFSESMELPLNFTLFNDTSSNGEKLTFTNFGRSIKLVVTPSENILCMIGGISSDSEGDTGDLFVGYYDYNTAEFRFNYSREETDKDAEVLTDTNFSAFQTKDNVIVLGSPKTRADGAEELNKNVIIKTVTDIDEDFPFGYESVTYIPPQNTGLSNLGNQVELTDQYLLFADSLSSRGVVFVAYRQTNTTYQMKWTLNPYPRWGNFQEFGSHLNVMEMDDYSLVLIGARSAWIHNNVRRATEDGIDVFEMIGVMYRFRIEDDECSLTHYFVVKSEVVDGIMNSTISSMTSISNRAYVTLSNFDGLYRVECDETITVHL
ncbi:Uncharacterized protein QTN25_009228 [Entamoeba marina]